MRFGCKLCKPRPAWLHCKRRGTLCNVLLPCMSTRSSRWNIGNSQPTLDQESSLYPTKCQLSVHDEISEMPEWAYKETIHPESWYIIRTSQNKNKELNLLNSEALLLPAKKLSLAGRWWQNQRGLFPAITQSFISQNTQLNYSRSHHGDPSEGGHALADSGQVVEVRRGAVLLAEPLHRLDCFGHRLQESRQDCLNRTETTCVFTVFLSFITGLVYMGSYYLMLLYLMFCAYLLLCLTHIRGFLGGGCRHEELSLTGERLLHHFSLERQRKTWKRFVENVRLSQGFRTTLRFHL